MVADSTLPHVESGPNGHRKDAPPFTLKPKNAQTQKNEKVKPISFRFFGFQISHFTAEKLFSVSLLLLKKGVSNFGSGRSPNPNPTVGRWPD